MLHQTIRSVILEMDTIYQNFIKGHGITIDINFLEPYFWIKK